MARSTRPPEPKPARLSIDDMERGIRRLQKRLDMMETFDPDSLDRMDPYSTVRPLQNDIETALTETFGRDSVEYVRYRYAAVLDWPVFIGRDSPHHDKVEAVAKDRLRSIQLLTAAIELLRERLAEAGGQAPPKGAASPPLASSKRIFIVHGQDSEPKEAVGRFLERLGYEPVILHEQANKGRTIIQKFQDEAADVGFAIVLMTADDTTSDGTKRARQNVILELGFFLGRLGPSRVAAIVKGDIEKPSDFDGVVYISYDGGWKTAVAKELKAADYEVDWNVVMG